MRVQKKLSRASQATLVLASVIFMLMVPFAQGASYSGLQAYGVDTVAGYSTLLSTSKMAPGQDVVIAVKKPDGAVVHVPARTDDDGVAKVDLYDYHTRRAGSYSVMAYLKGQAAAGAVSYFTVYPDEISSSNSTLVAQTTMARATGNDPVYLIATLKDQYGNPFSGHTVNIISSRSDDTVHSTSAVTDPNGSATFYVTTYTPGVSVYSAIDTTTDTVLDSRPQVAYLSGDSYLDDAGGYLDGFIPVARAAGPLNHFLINGLPSTVQPNQNVSFSTTAQDQDDLTVENYTGTIRFSAEGENSINVTLPEDYTFKAEDLGTHEFSLGLKFATAGTYTIVATDITNTLIKGEKTIVVGSSSEDETTPPSSGTGDKPSVLTPVAGFYSLNVQTVSGSASPGLTVKIFDNDQEIGSAQSSSAGSYTYQTAPLSDGEHSIYVVTVDAGNTVLETSDTVLVTIDTTPASVDEVTIDPTEGISTGEVMNVKVLSEPGLSQAALIFNDEIFELSPSLDQDGMYVASLQAPANPGEYPLDVLLVDELGNEATYKDEALITISEDGTAAVTQEEGSLEGTTQETIETEETLEEQPFLPSGGDAPSQVFGLIAFGSDSRVTLVWEAATDDGLIDHYKVYYGLDPANLSDSVDTLDASTTWYVPDLENGKEYYFAVSAVDDGGLESENMSELVNGIPFQLEVETALPVRPETELGSLQEDPLLRGAASSAVPPEMVKNGPELLWILFGTGAASGLARKLSRRKRRLQK